MRSGFVSLILIMAMSPLIAYAASVGSMPGKGPVPFSAATKLILDVDVGSDDAIAMLVALGAEQQAKDISGPKLLAVTAVHGNTNLQNVMKNVLKTLKVANRLDVPVYAGTSHSLTVTPPSDNYFGMDGFGDFDYPNAPDPAHYVQKEHAVNALTRLARENPGEITVVALGALTNIALAIRMDDDFLSNIKQLVILGGSTEGVGNVKSGMEYNFYVDPEANFIVFNSTNNEDKPIILVPWESVSERNLITMDWRRNVLGKIPSAKIELINNAERYQLQDPNISYEWVSADPVTMGLILQPDLITSYEIHHIDAETGGSYGRGAVFVDYKNRIQPKNVIIIKEFNVEGYKKLLLQTLS